jgi:hypothetical protein
MQKLPATGNGTVFCNRTPVVFKTLSCQGLRLVYKSVPEKFSLSWTAERKQRIATVLFSKICSYVFNETVHPLCTFA